MRILCFTNIPSGYKEAVGGYNGGGWLYSLENELKKYPGVELAMSFLLDGEPWKVVQNGVTYYPIIIPKISKVDKVLRMLSPRKLKYDLAYVESYLKVVEDFSPDIIEVFGSEGNFGLIASETSIPVLLHIQGILNPYLNAFLPPFFSWQDYYWEDMNVFAVFRRIVNRSEWLRNCYREHEIIHRVNYFIGRTVWDERVTKVINPNACYFYGSEILRSEFYDSNEREIPKRMTIVSTISQPLYKGFDLVLKTANILKNSLGFDFIWEVYGNINPSFIEKSLRIYHKEVNVVLKGVANASVIRDSLLQSTAFVNPSYIDNSPNSVCEAQIMGCPVVSTNVGGISSLIQDAFSGFLVPSNDPYQMAYVLKMLHDDKHLNKQIGSQAKHLAEQRHNRIKIVKELMETYNAILEKQ